MYGIELNRIVNQTKGRAYGIDDKMIDSESKPARKILVVFVCIIVSVLPVFWLKFALTFGTIPAIFSGLILGIFIWKSISYMNQEKVIIKIGNFEFDCSPLPDQPHTHNQIFPPRSPTRTFPQRSRHISNEVRAQVRIKYNHRCAICHRTEKETGTLHHIDHILPFSKGGTNDFNNLQLLCERCNLEKRDQW
jgi:hypothetical protein